jgi:phosphodiesterase/alkaline phosphatase D-like protein
MIFRFAFASMALFFVLSDFSVSAQFITHGPIVSAVTPSSARMFVRTVTASNIDVELSEDSLFGSVLTFSNTTKATKDSSEVVDLTGLQPWTEYYYRVKVNGTEDTLNGHFRTAPNVGERNHYTFLVGSCSEYDFITKPWDAAIENRPHLFSRKF